MLGNALYYPFIDIRDPAWLRSAILFWDRIQTIVPRSIANPYMNSDTRICEDEGYLRPLYSDLHSEVLQKLGERILNLSERPNWLDELFSAPTKADPSVKALKASETLSLEMRDSLSVVGIYPEKLSPDTKEALVRAGLARIHPAKLPRNLRAKLEAEPSLPPIDRMSGSLKRIFGYREEYDGEWLLVDSRFADAYMTALAAMLARETNLSPLTHQTNYQGLNLRCLIDEEVGAGDHQVGAGEHDARGTLLTIVMRNLQVDPDASVRKLIAFRRKNADQLAELSARFDGLKSSLEKSQDQRELEERAKRILENEIRPGLNKLKKELQDQSINAAWKGFYQAATLSTTAGFALTHFAQANSLSVAGVGLFITTANVAIEAAFTRRRTRTSSPYTYLLDIEKRFSLPKYQR
jgi:hypothetical protein